MLWQKRVAAPDGPGSPVDLRTLTGLPGRLLFAEGYVGHRMASVPCTVRKVDRADIVVEILSESPCPTAESAVILEVINQTALVQCFTSVRTAAKNGEAVLRTPSRPHVVQRRRFPRIDLFLSVAIFTPDRPIDSLPAQMINLSIDGAACVVAEPVPPGSEVKLNLTNLGMHPSDVQASVVRCTPNPSHLWVLGVQFRSLAPEQELYLGKYISDFVDQRSG